MPQATQAKILTPRELARIRYPLPPSWTAAIGVLKGKKVNPLRYQRKMRLGWTKRRRMLERARAPAHGR